MSGLLLAGGKGILPFRLRRVYCVARNYAEHNREMGGSDRDEPFFFQKPWDAVFQATNLGYPPGTKKFSFEAELVAIMGAEDRIFGYAVGVDLTKRDVQAEAKKTGRPWETAKAFDLSGLIGEIGGNLSSDLLSSCKIQFTQNGVMQQQAGIADMIWGVTELVGKLKEQNFSVKEGDLIFTGTPGGVGELRRGDACLAQVVDSSGADVLPPVSFTMS